MENQPVDFIIKPGPFRATRRLSITSGYIEFEDKSTISDPFTRFEKSDITGLCYGVRWLYAIGWQFDIYVRSKNNEVIKIYFGALFAYRKTERFNLYKEIIDTLWDFYFEEKAQDLIREYNEEGLIEICGVSITSKHIVIKKEGILKPTEYIIPWDKVGIRDYNNHFVIYSANERTNIHKAFYYKDEWNAATLHSLISTFLKHIIKTGN